MVLNLPPVRSCFDVHQLLDAAHAPDNSRAHVLGKTFDPLSGSRGNGLCANSTPLTSSVDPRRGLLMVGEQCLTRFHSSRASTTEQEKKTGAACHQKHAAPDEISVV